MRTIKKSWSTAILTGSALLLTAGVAGAQAVVNLTAVRQSTVAPDGNIIPMWGWLCGNPAATSAGGTGTPAAAGGATCTQTNGVPQATGTSAPSAIWQPPLIEVPYTPGTTTLQIVLTNSLPVPTSLTIVGQIPAGTGSAAQPTSADPNGAGNPTRENGRPQHAGQAATTWTTVVGGGFTPPTQGARAQSFVQESCGTIAANNTGMNCTNGAITYNWANLAPGTYLIESGSYPSIQGPMGLYGVLVVTAQANAGSFVSGTAYPSPCVASSVSCVTTGGVPYDADGVLLLSEIDAVQNQAADTAVQTAGFSAFTPWTTACSATGSTNPAIPSAPNTCYPPAVDFTPTYYLINGHSFDRTQPVLSTLAPGATTSAGCTATSCTITQANTYSTGNVLLRFVNAGLRMHMPSVAGLQMALIAEDAHLQPELMQAFSKGLTPAACPSGNLQIKLNTATAAVCPKVQNDWFMAAGKTLDVVVQPAGATAAYPATGAFFPAFDRQLSLSNNNQRDGGMQALVMINAGTSTISTSAGGVTSQSGYSAAGVSLAAFTFTAQAVADNYVLPANSTAPITFNVLANDIGVSNAVPISGAAQCVITSGIQAPGQSNCLYLNGMYTYAPAAANTPLSFMYCGNGATSGGTCAQVTVAAASIGTGPTLGLAPIFNSHVNTLMNVSQPGVLALDTDANGYRLYASIQNTAVAANSAGSAPQSPAVGWAAPLNVVEGSATASGCTVTLQSNGSFTAIRTAGAAGAASVCTFQYYAVNSQGTAAGPQTATVNFPASSNLKVTVRDPNSNQVVSDYKWVIEQDLTFKIDPACEVNNGPGGAIPMGSDGKPCPAGGVNNVPPTLATNFHTSYMPVIASGCTGAQSCERGQSVYNPADGTHVPAACNHGICLASGSGSLPISMPGDVQLNAFEPDGVTPARYYISILPGDAGNPFNVAANGYTGDFTQPGCELDTGVTTPTGQDVPVCGHTMGGAAIPRPTCAGAGAAAVCTFPNGNHTTGVGGGPLPGSPEYPLVVNVQPNPLLTAQLAIFVFEDDAPLNGEHDQGGNNNEPGLGGFQVELWDEMAQSGDFTGQMTYDIFNMPLSNSLNGMIDPLTGNNACPVGATDADSNGNKNQVASGMIIVCPQYESDGVTPSPLAGNALVKNLMPGRFGVIVHPSAAREAAGEVWYQTNTLDGTHFLDSFVKVGEPPYFQEYGPGGWHVFMGMANPAVINGRKPGFCNGPPKVSCTNTVQGQVSNLHENRAPDETLYDSGVFPQGDPRNYQALAHTNCWASLGDPDGLTFAFTLCDGNGNFKFSGIPDGNWALVVGDVWNDLIIDGSSKPVNVCSGAACAIKTPNPYNIDAPTFSWQTHIWTNAFMDLNGNGIQDDPLAEPGLIQVPMRIRFRNGRFNNTAFTDNTGHANFNETFPLFSWYVTESDDTRFKNTGVHVVYDFGGPIDGPSGKACLGATQGGSSNQANSSANPCGNGRVTDTTGAANPYQGLLNSVEPAAVALPLALRHPGSYYCANGDCGELNGHAGFPAAGGPGGSTGRVDPGSVVTEGLQGFLSQTEILEWGKAPYLAGENGGIRGHVVYGSTRPFDDPMILFQNLWEPLVPRVRINLYRETAQPDGTIGLTLVDSTTTSSWDDYAQGHDPVRNVPNLNCPGQPTSDPFFNYTLAGTPNYLDSGFPLPNSSQFKCYDGMHNFNQVQPAPYDGLYIFPSAACATTAGAPFSALVNGETVNGTCGEVANPNAGQPGSPATILPPGKYVAEIVVPSGYELVKEEDKNILIGDAFIGSAVIANQFVGLGNIYIVPDQANINQNNINGAYNPAMYSNLTNGSYVGPNTGQNPYTVATCGTSTSGGCSAGNFSQPTATMGRDTFAGFGPGGLITLNTPCVGEVRIVPDFMSISPESGQVAPFAGSSRPLCDRKEITLEDQMQAQAEFFVWTKTPAATHYTGFILDDFSSEFDQASPSFGEKFAVPNLPVSIRDFNGVEVERVYSDQWGLFNGLLFSTWEVNPPNPTGYSPGMYITEMNSPGPIAAPVCITAPTGTAQGFPPGCVTTQTLAGNPVKPTVTVTDPYFNPGYSTFDYENPFMPADTTYLDTPVIPTMAFAEAYNPPDCAYPDATPAIASVVANGNLATTGAGDGLTLNGASLSGAGPFAGPWVSVGGTVHTLLITALGDQLVTNYAYSGPAAQTAPYNQFKGTRHYGFGATMGSVTIGGVSLPSAGCTSATGCINSWSDTSITVAVPGATLGAGAVPLCSASNPTYSAVAAVGNAPARCGELIITTSTGKRSIDTVMVTIGGKRPSYILGEKLTPDTFGTTAANSSGNALQTAIDSAKPGDMIVIGPGTYTEMLQLWKPIRLQGVAAASVIVNANTQPAGKLDPWRRRLDCLFGLGMNGQLMGATVNGAPNPFDVTGQYNCPFGTLSPADPLASGGQAAVDPIQLEPVIGWDSNLNANVAETLQEPTLMGAYEGAAMTVLAKGLENYSFGDVGTTCDAEGSGGCVLLNSCPVNVASNPAFGLLFCTNLAAVRGFTVRPGDCNPTNLKFYTSNFLCNPARVDGITLTNSSQGGGAIFAHGWTHYLEISNTRITGNAGTLTGGITVGQPEVPDPALGGFECPALGGPGSNNPLAFLGFIGPTDANPLCIQAHVNMHNNAVTFNSSYGDELNSNTPAAGGGVTVNTGSDDYAFTHNFVCGNLSSGDGGGMTHFGLSMNGDIEHNAFLFNQSTNPTLTTNGGGLIVEGNAPDGTFAENSQIDTDAGPSLSDGTGSVTVNANLMLGNTAESGEGGGLRLQSINGNDILNNPTTPSFGVGFFAVQHWYTATVTNNVIVDNVAGWEGGGVSIQDAVAVTFMNNTVVSNDETSTAGVLFDTLGAQFAGTPPPGCNPDTGAGCGNPVVGAVSAQPKPAGLVTHPHSLLLSPAFTPAIVATSCPNAGTGVGQAGYTAAQSCTKVSLPVLSNNIIFNNRPFSPTVAGTPAVMVLAPAVSQSATPLFANGVVTGGTGACGAGANFWDLGVYGDGTIMGGNPGGYVLNPTYSILTSLTGPGAGYGTAAAHNLAGPAGGSNLFKSMYCNGARVPPEIATQLCTVNAAAPPGTGPAGAPGCIYPGAVGITTPPGVPDNNPFYQPFNLTPAATVDEGNNWINMFYGPLTTVNPTLPRSATVGNPANPDPTTIYGNPLANYAPNSAGALMVGKIPAAGVTHTTTDFYGQTKPVGVTDIGAIENTDTLLGAGAGAGTGGGPLPNAVLGPAAPAGMP